MVRIRFSGVAAGVVSEPDQPTCVYVVLIIVAYVICNVCVCNSLYALLPHTAAAAQRQQLTVVANVNALCGVCI